MNFAAIQGTGRNMDKLTRFHVPSKSHFLKQLTAGKKTLLIGNTPLHFTTCTNLGECHINNLPFSTL